MLSPRAMFVIRMATIASGVALLLVAVGVDRYGLGDVGAFGRGQSILLLWSLLLIVAGISGGRFFARYRTIAVLSMTTVLLLSALELTAIVLVRAGIISSPSHERARQYRAVPYYRRESWAEKFWRESGRAESYRYEPFVGWQHRPFAGELVNVDENGLRRTPGADCRAEAWRIFTFGGSTLWGWGSPDWGTIPAQLQKELNARLENPVCVTNFGEDSYVSTQEVVALLRHLQLANIPQTVIFYDGVNDVVGAWRTGRAGVHPAVPEMVARFEGARAPTLAWIKTSRLFWLLQRLRRSAGGGAASARIAGLQATPGPTSADMASAVVDVYLSNYRAVTSLGSQYGFESYFFWQPQLGIGRKSLTAQEEEILSQADPDLRKLTEDSYKALSSRAAAHDRLWDLSDVFDDSSEQVWIDDCGHVTPRGNEIVAERIAEIILARNAR
jgi:hypothetical protein